jgi:serine/threonine-protein kinase
LVVAGPARAQQCPDGSPPPCRPRAAPARPAPNSVAVLVFENAARDTSLDWLGDGLAEEVATQLGAATGVTVRGAGIVRSAANVAGRDPRRVAQLVSVRYVVEGSYRRAGARVRVSARLLALPAGDQRWGRVYDRSRDSLATLSDEIAHDLAVALGASTRRVERRPPNPQSYEAYQRGRSFLLRYDIPTAKSLFEEAIAHDSTFAPAWAGLALAWGELADVTMAPLEALPRAREAARRALALDSTIPNAYLALAWAAAALDRDCQGGVRLADRALALDSMLPEAWAARGTILLCQRRGADALVAARRAWDLDSLSGYTGAYLVMMTWFVEPQRMPEVLASALQRLTSDWAQYMGADVARRRGDCATAEQLSRPLAATNFLERYVEALVCLGRRAEADSVVRAAIADTSRRYVNPVTVAVGLLALGDRDGAMRWLERGADERTWWIMLIHVREDLAPLREDPRFQALERRLGLQP